MGGSSTGIHLDMQSLQSTAAGREALATLHKDKVHIVSGQSGDGASYDAKTHTLTLDPTDPNPDGTLVRKMAELDYMQKHKHDLNLNLKTATSHNAYVKAQLDKEAYAYAKEFEFDKGAGLKTGNPLQNLFDKACAAFKHKHPHATQQQIYAAGEKAIRENLGKTVVDGSKTGQTYAQLYGHDFDAHHGSGLPSHNGSGLPSQGETILALMAKGKL